MNQRAVSSLVWSTLVLTLLLGVLGTLLLLINDHSPSAFDTGYTLAFVSFLIVGLLIAARRPENPIGWMFCVIGLASAWDFFAQQYAIYALVTRPGALSAGVWMAWTRIWAATAAWALMFFALLLFPDGRLLSPRWRPFAWFAAGVLVLVGVLFAFEPRRLGDVRVPNPMGIERASGIIELSQSILAPIILGIGWAIAGAMIARFRRARGEERQQLEWLAYTAGFFLSLSVLRLLNIQLLHNHVIEFVGEIMWIVAIAIVPTSVGIAVLRYRLYEIDVVINRTLVYGSLTTTLVALYFGGIVVLQGVFVLLTGQQSTLAVVASTLLIAALFNPLRRRIQAFIDRRFYRRKYDARKTLEAFSTKLRDDTDLGSAIRRTGRGGKGDDATRARRREVDLDTTSESEQASETSLALFTGVRGRVILRSWRGAAERGIMSLVR